MAISRFESVVTLTGGETYDKLSLPALVRRIAFWSNDNVALYVKSKIGGQALTYPSGSVYDTGFIEEPISGDIWVKGSGDIQLEYWT